MSRTVKVLIWILIGIPLFLIVSLFIAFQVFVNMASPDHAFGEKPLPLAPDYSVRSNWAGWPDKDNPVERLPLSESPVPFEERPELGRALQIPSRTATGGAVLSILRPSELRWTESEFRGQRIHVCVSVKERASASEVSVECEVRFVAHESERTFGSVQLTPAVRGLLKKFRTPESAGHPIYSMASRR